MESTKVIGEEQLEIVKKTATFMYYQHLSWAVTPGTDGFITMEELYHQGVIGLLKAEKNFDESFQTSFKTYALYRIKGEILSFIRDKIALIRVPQKRYQDIKKLIMEKEGGKTSFDSGESLGWSQNKVVQIEILKPRIVSTDDGKKEEEAKGTQQGVTLKSNGKSPEEVLEEKEIFEIVSLCIEGISRDDERHILISRYMKNKTLEELSISYNCSIQTIKNRQIKAQESVKRCLKRNGVE